jgi:tetratricopeptide (TPR) repeat protein
MFKHALTQEVAYATLLAQRRRALHRLVAAAIEELHQDRLAEHHETLAHHYSAGQAWEKALHHLEKAGDKAVAAYANHDALRFYARALEVCERLGEQAVPTAASVSARRGFVNFCVGDLPGAIADFDRMVAASRRLGNRSLEGTALGYRGLLEVWNNDWERGEATLRTAWAIVEEGFEEVRPLASYGLFFLLLTSNRLPEAEPLLITPDEAAALPDPFFQGAWNMALGFLEYWWGRPDEALRILQAIPEEAARVMFNRLTNWWAQTLALGTRGDYDAALSLLQHMKTTSERLDDTLMRARVLNTVGWIYGELQDPGRAMAWNQASVEMIRSLPDFPNPDVEMHARLNLGDNLVALGRPEEAETQFQTVEAVTRSTRPSDRWMAWRYSQHLLHSYGELWLQRGDLDRALACADECLELANHFSSRKNVVKGRRLRGQVLLALGRADEAEQELSAALAAAIELGNPPQLWKTHVALGDLRRAQGRSAGARAAYAEALAVVERVAAGLADETLGTTLRRSEHVQAIRRTAGLPGGG